MDPRFSFPFDEFGLFHFIYISFLSLSLSLSFSLMRGEIISVFPSPSQFFDVALSFPPYDEHPLKQ